MTDNIINHEIDYMTNKEFGQYLKDRKNEAHENLIRNLLSLKRGQVPEMTLEVFREAQRRIEAKENAAIIKIKNSPNSKSEKNQKKIRKFQSVVKKEIGLRFYRFDQLLTQEAWGFKDIPSKERKNVLVTEKFLKQRIREIAKALSEPSIGLSKTENTKSTEGTDNFIPDSKKYLKKQKKILAKARKPSLWKPKRNKGFPSWEEFSLVAKSRIDFLSDNNEWLNSIALMVLENKTGPMDNDSITEFSQQVDGLACIENKIFTNCNCLISKMRSERRMKKIRIQNNTQEKKDGETAWT